MKTAVVTGSAGQDGTYLTAHLSKLGYRVVGVPRPPGAIDLQDAGQVHDLLQTTRPDEIYHLAACHHSSETQPTDDLAILDQSYQVHVRATAHLLEAIRRLRPSTRFFYAGSCRVFAASATTKQDEHTPGRPDNLYGITKQAGMELCRYYRQKHGLFAAVGILYNHESPLRQPSFVSQKIVRAAGAISRGQQRKLVLGDLDAAMDWGYAGDYVVAMHQILQLSEPGDFVIASGEQHRVREFVALAFQLLGLDWERYVQIDPALVRRPLPTSFLGDHSKLTARTGWRPTTSFPELVRIMVNADRQQHASP